MQPAARTRYDWIDVMKLIAIWLMYMAHYDGMGRYGMVGISVRALRRLQSGVSRPRRSAAKNSCA